MKEYELRAAESIDFRLVAGERFDFPVPVR
jgi:hypothetical protein